MSDASNRANIFGLYTAKPATDAQVPASEREPYQAVELARVDRSPMLRIYRHSEVLTELKPYGLLLDVEMRGPKDVALLFNTGAYFLQGENLDQPLKGGNDADRPLTLLDALQLHRVWALVPFNADRHAEPADGEPVIYNIKFESAASLQGQ